MPASSAILAMVTPFLWSLSQPVRVFRVTGIGTALTTVVKIFSTSASSCINAEPAKRLQTFFAGQPILISIISAPRSMFNRAASASICGS